MFSFLFLIINRKIGLKNPSDKMLNAVITSLKFFEYLLNILCDKIISKINVISVLNKKIIINTGCGSLNTKNNIIVIVEINVVIKRVIPRGLLFPI